MAREHTKWTPEEKLQLVLGSYKVKNLSAYCRKVGIDRRYLYELREDLERSMVSEWSSRKVGRPRKDDADSVDELRARVEALEADRQRMHEEMTTLQVQAEMADFLADVTEGVLEEELGRKKKSSSRGSASRHGAGSGD